MITKDSAPTLELHELDVSYKVRGRDRPVLRGLTFTIHRGETFGLVGESGSGKSTAALAVVGYLPSNGRVRGGTIQVAGRNVVGQSFRALRRLRANDVSMVYQDPGQALNPSIRIGDQVAEVFEVRGLHRHESLERAQQALAKVQIADPASVMGRYPHQLSGGMQQRVVIAMALAKDPALLILDEPTTSLDATVEAEVLDLILQLKREFHTSVLFITHNLGIVAKMCDRVGVLYAGRLVEEGPVGTVLNDPHHPYTVGLIRCVPRGGMRKDLGRLDTIPGFMPSIDEDLKACVFADRCGLVQDICRQEEPPLYQITPDHGSRCYFHQNAKDLPRAVAGELARPMAVDRSAVPLVEVTDLAKDFRQQGHLVHALAGVSAAIWPGETLGLVGESGSGKTTFGRALLGLIAPSEGTVKLQGRLLPARLAQRSQEDIRVLQIVFQNPDSALNRRHTVRRILRRALFKLARLRGDEAEKRLATLAQSVRLRERYLAVRPRQLSGGLKQRVAIARAFAGEPRLVVCDEPTSALDVSVQAAILNLLADLQGERRVAYLFISHDLGVVRFLSDRIGVLYLGRLMELGPAEVVFNGPHHPYTEALLSAVPTIDGGGRDRIRLQGEIPSAAAPPSGCVFHTRCHRKIGAICETTPPPLLEVEPGHLMACHIPLEELRRLQRKGDAGTTVPAAAAVVAPRPRPARPRPDPQPTVNLEELDGRIGEGWGGQSPNGSHVNIVLARRGSPTAAAAISMFAHPAPGHTPVLVCVGPEQPAYEPVWPPTLMMNKNTALEEPLQTMTWGAAQLGVGQGVLDAVAAGFIEATGELLVLVSIWIDGKANDETALRLAARAAVREAVEMCVRGRDPKAATRLVTERDRLRNPFYHGR